MLLFQKKFLPLIRAGQKRQTLRVWNCRRMKPGQRSYIPGIGGIKIHSVEPVAWNDLTCEDAVADGFATLQELLQELTGLYPEGIPNTHLLYRVCFALESEL